MGQYYFAGWRLSSYVVVVCNAVGGQAGWPPGAWTVGALAAGPRGQSSGRHCTAGQYGYVPLGRSDRVEFMKFKERLDYGREKS